MRLDELFADFTANSLRQRLTQDILDLITPLLAQHVPFITMHQVIDLVRTTRPGIAIDRGTIMELLDPEQIPAISKIEGDRIYLQGQPPPGGESGEEAAEQDRKHVHDTAVQQAKHDLDKPAPKPAADAKS